MKNVFVGLIMFMVGVNPQILNGQKFFQDNDRDGFGNERIYIDTSLRFPPIGYVLDSTDCDDNNDFVYPGAIDVPGNQIDEDCDGYDLIVKASVFPNPFDDLINIEYPSDREFTLFVLDIYGRIWYEKEMTLVHGMVSISLSNFPNGVYIIRGVEGLEEEVFAFKILRK